MTTDDVGATRSVRFPLPRLAQAMQVVGLYLASITAALGISALLVAVTGDSPGDVFTAMIDGAIRLEGAVGRSIDQATPILLVALGTSIAFRAGLINLGQEGQLLIGATAAAAVAVKVAGPSSWLMIPLVLLAATAGGALYAGIAAWLRNWRGVSEVLGTLLLVFVAVQVVSLMVSRSYLLRQKAPTGPSGQVLNRLLASERIDESLQLGEISVAGNSFHFGFIIALAAAVVIAVMFSRSMWGFRLRLLGLNPRVAQRSGVRAAALGGWALVMSGALAGLAGGVMLTGREFELASGFSNGVGWEGLLVALVGRNRPAAIVPAAIFFGMLRSGGGLLIATGVARFIVEVVQALLVLSLLLPPLYIEARARRRRALEMAERV